MNGVPNMDVFWSSVINNDTHRALTLLWEEPIPLLKHLYNVHKNNILPLGTNFFKCPSVNEEIKNTYVILSPIDYTIKWDGDEITTPDYNKMVFKHLVTPHYYEDGKCSNVVSVGLHTLWFSDQKCVITVTPPYMSNTEFSKNMTMISGQLDINSWLRPLDVLFFLENDKPVFIKKGEPLLYVKFHTDKKIKLKRFNYSTEVDKIVNYCVGVRYYSSVSPLSKIYDIFNRSLIRKKFSNIVKNEII